MIDSLNREHWSPRLQRVYFTENSAVFLAGTDAAASLSSDGRKLHKPIMSVVQDEVYVPGVDINLSDIEAEDQELVVDQKRSASAYIDDVKTRVHISREMMKNFVNCWNVLRASFATA